MMNQQDAARAVLIELVNILGAFKGHLVIVGGWVPDLIYPSKNHVGSFDVDLAVGPGAVGADAYSSIANRNFERTGMPIRAEVFDEQPLEFEFLQAVVALLVIQSHSFGRVPLPSG